MAETFNQSKDARALVLRLRYTSGIIALAAVAGPLLVWITLAEPQAALRLVAAVTLLAVISLPTVAATLLLKKARATELGSVLLSDEGIQFEAKDIESLGGSVPWSRLGKVIRRDDWQLRRADVQTLVVLPAGKTNWIRSGLKGSFGNAILVASWLPSEDAQRAEFLIRQHGVP